LLPRLRAFDAVRHVFRPLLEALNNFEEVPMENA
jgi:hypothetical protein